MTWDISLEMRKRLTDISMMYSIRQLAKCIGICSMLQYDIDGWFLDGPEPDHVASFLPQKTFLGEAQRVRNIYPLLHSSNFKQLLDEVRPGKRHYMLTRCAWAGQQRYGTAVWSGDIPATMDELRLQITAGLNFTATGIPYWTTDIGGYLGGDPSDKAYREVFTRWFHSVRCFGIMDAAIRVIPPYRTNFGLMVIPSKTSVRISSGCATG